MTSTRSLAAIAAALSVTGAAVALAAPDRTADLSASARTFQWDGGPITGAAGGLETSTDDTLVKLADAGDLIIKLTKFEEPAGTGADFDVRLYKADAAGEPTGDPVGESLEADAEQESLTVRKLAAGAYVIVVNAFTTIEGTFHGSATLSGGAPPAPTATATAGPEVTSIPTVTATATADPGTTDATPDAAIAKFGKRGFSGTATDDRGVASVRIAVQRKKGKKCRQLSKPRKFVKQAKCDAPTRFLTAKGTTKWKLKFKKAKQLKKGRYTVFARAIDNGGQAQAGFTPASKRTFKVK